MPGSPTNGGTVEKRETPDFPQWEGRTHTGATQLGGGPGVPPYLCGPITGNRKGYLLPHPFSDDLQTATSDLILVSCSLHRDSLSCLLSSQTSVYHPLFNKRGRQKINNVSSAAISVSERRARGKPRAHPTPFSRDPQNYQHTFHRGLGPRRWPCSHSPSGPAGGSLLGKV